MLKDSDLFVNVIKIISSTFFNELFENVWIKANGGDVDVFSVVFDGIVKYEQVSLILERERSILRRKGQRLFLCLVLDGCSLWRSNTSDY